MTEREVSSERVSEERLEEMLADAIGERDRPIFGDGSLYDFHPSELVSALSELLDLRSSVKTVGVPEAMELLRKALAADVQNQSLRNEMLATLIVNLEKADPTAELAVALRDFVRRERPKLSAIEAPSEGEDVRDPWVDTRLVRFDDTVQFGHGGFDFDRWEGLRSEMHTRHGSFAVWNSGDRSWSMYGGKYGVMALDRYSCEEHAKADVEQYLLSLDNEVPAAPSEVTEEMVEQAARAIVSSLWDDEGGGVIAVDLWQSKQECVDTKWKDWAPEARAALKGGE